MYVWSDLKLNSICEDQMEDYMFEDLEAKNLIQDILSQQLNMAMETFWYGDVFGIWNWFHSPYYRYNDFYYLP